MAFLHACALRALLTHFLPLPPPCSPSQTALFLTTMCVAHCPPSFPSLQSAHAHARCTPHSPPPFFYTQMWSCLLFMAGAATVSVLSASLNILNYPSTFLPGVVLPPGFSSFDSMAWTTLLMLWLLWHAWLLVCECSRKQCRQLTVPHAHNQCIPPPPPHTLPSIVLLSP